MQDLWLHQEQKCEGIVASVVFRARDIMSTNVLLYPDGDGIAFVASCIHPGLNRACIGF
jgi:hypothetical protein